MIRRVLLSAALAAFLTAPAAGAREPAQPLGLVERVLYSHRGTGPTRVRSLRSPANCPNPVTCETFKLSRGRWPTGADGRLVMPYRYNDAGRPSRAPDVEAVRRALRASTAEWHRWNSNVVFSDAGTTTARPGARGPRASCADGVNSIGWRTLPIGVLGVTYLCFDTRTNLIQEADTALNAALPWGILGSSDPASRIFDVQSIFTHELGHWLSLLDLYGLRTRSLTMFGSGKPGLIGMRTLALADIVGAQTAYPCAPDDRCPRAGIAAD